jgi:hypothetical protein
MQWLEVAYFCGLFMLLQASRSATFFFKASISASEEFVCVVYSLVAGRLIHEILVHHFF